MFPYELSFLYVVCIILSPASTRINDDEVNEINIVPKPSNEKVTITLLYEVFCRGCRQFDTEQFAPTVVKLSPYLNVQSYPYGNAITEVFKNGTYQITCQHGPKECYGNMLHACAIDYFRNITKTVSFNSCMMLRDKTHRGSDDDAADTCAQQMGIDVKEIKECAKGKKGLELLYYYGELSSKIHYHYVPFIMINGKEFTGDRFFMRSVCAAFTKPPPPCL